MGLESSLRGLIAVAALMAGTLTGSLGGFTPPGCGIGPRLEIVPTRPSAGDPLTVIAAGDWTDSCVPRKMEVSQAGSLLTVRAIHDYPPGTGCLTVITPWRLVLPIGVLVPGSYTAELYVDYPGSAGSAGPCVRLPFDVTGIRKPWYLPLIQR